MVWTKILIKIINNKVEFNAKYKKMMTHEVPISSTISLANGQQKSQIDLFFPAKISTGGINDNLPEILVITTFPPRECGIATYSQDLIKALNNKFGKSFRIQICALESENERHAYTDDIKYRLNTDEPKSFVELAESINTNADIKIVLMQHEFGFFEKQVTSFYHFLNVLNKPIVMVFHTVLSDPSEALKIKVKQIANAVRFIIVMTNTSAKILIKDYAIPKSRITVIPHGTHLVSHSNKGLLKNRYNLSGKRVLSTFGLLSSGKSIETTLRHSRLL